MEREVLQAEVSEARARQCDEVQFKAKQSNVNQGNVKHEAMHMHVRRKATQCNTLSWKPDARTMEREVLQADVSEASARQCDEVMKYSSRRSRAM